MKSITVTGMVNIFPKKCLAKLIHPASVKITPYLVAKPTNKRIIG